MSGQWADSGRREELPEDWYSLRKQVKARDGGRCRWILPSGARCPRPGTDVDHRYDPADHRLRALWLLCGHHHDQKTSREAAAGRRKRYTIRAQPAERHPGRLR